MSEARVLSKTIFDQNEYSTTTFEESGGKIILNKTMDAEPILNANKRDYNNWSTKADHSKDGLRHAARIPVTIWANWMKETNGAIQHDQKLLYKYLNDPDNKFLRTNPTKL
jgi:hypothetical protein